MRRLASNLLLLAISTGISLVIGELVCRALFPQIGWRMFPDVGLGWANREYNHFDPLKSPKREGVPRILFLGDSNLAGSGVSTLDKRFPTLLKDRFGGTADVQILATGGWGTDQQFLAFRQKGKDWRPDIVVLAFCADNDISNIISHTHVAPDPDKRTLKPYFVLENQALQLFDGLGEALTEMPYRRRTISNFQSYLFDLIRFSLDRKNINGTARNSSPGVDPRYKKFGDPTKTKPAEIKRLQEELSWSPEKTVSHASAYIYEDFHLNSYQWKLFESILGNMDDEAESVNATLVTMLLPSSYNPRDPRFIIGSGFEFQFRTPGGAFTFRTEEPRDRLREICARLEIPFFDPTADFFETVTAAGLLKVIWPNPNDRHFSDRGHEILSSLTGDLLSELPEGSKLGLAD